MTMIRVIHTNVTDAYGYIESASIGFRWVFRYDPGAEGEFHIYESGKSFTVKEAVDEIYSWIREYDFKVGKELSVH